MRSLMQLHFLIFYLSVGISTCYPQTDMLTSFKTLQPDSVTTIKKDVQEVALVLSVTDHRKHFVKNLTSTDFTIHDNGLPPARITYFQAQTRLPLKIALVIDSSDSVRYSFDLEKHAAQRFLRKVMRSGADLALVIGFNAQPQIIQAATANRDLLSGAVKRLPPGGDTAVYDAVVFASKELAMIGTSQPSRRIIILITDGDDNSSHITLQGAAEIAQNNETMIYVLNSSIDFLGGSKEVELAMKHLSEMTGGQYFRADSEEHIEAAFSRLEDGLRSQYAIGYTPSQMVTEGSYHRIFVLGPRSLLIRHRQGYLAK
jgi:Ca-activated chloride channel homolog